MDQWPPHFRKLYRESNAEDLGFSFTDFAHMLRFTNCENVADLVLAQACCRGQPLAWEQFSRRFGRKLYAAALAIARHESIARELADSLLSDIWRTKLATYTGRGSLEGWLKAVLAQAYVDRYRSRRREVSLEERLTTIRQPAWERRRPRTPSIHV